MIFQLAKEMQPALGRPTKHHRSLPVLVKVTNALQFIYFLL